MSKQGIEGSRDRGIKGPATIVATWSTAFSLCLVLSALFVLLALPGCGRGHAPLWSQANPQTEVAFNPITRTLTLFNNKDVNLTVEEFSGETAEGAKWVVRGLTIVDQSSPVRLANVQQLEVAERITRAAFEGFGEAFGKIIAEAMAPLRGASATVETPIGSGSIATGGGGDAKVETSKSQKVETGAAAAQPGNREPRNEPTG